ncbi:flavin reductase family protein [Mesorhizobium sp. ASY16-5R]|uniref:flavin reductase family protein n=1 Tax=Mesorhizobium sp. ASY16-5R TaxID=3445772 RepID=UPI003FA0604F
MNQCVDSFAGERVDPQAFRAAIGAFATGVAVVTASDAGAWFGMTMNSLTSVSLDPCLLLICPKKGSATGSAMKASGQFGVSLLNNSQKELAGRFVGRAASMAERFDGLNIDIGQRGLPLLRDALSSFECVVRDIHSGGDHDIVIGEVISCRRLDGEPLVFFRGGFGKYQHGH